MSTKPSTTPVQWDANDTNITTPSAGQQSDGSATNAILASGIFNYLQRWETAWVRFLARGPVRKLGVAAGVGLNTSGAVSGAYANADGLAWSPSATTDKFVWSIEVAEGERLKSVALRCDPNAAGDMTLTVVREAAGTPTTVGTPASSTGSAVETITVTMTEDVDDSPQTHYSVIVSFATSTVQSVFGIAYSCESTA